MNNSANVYSVSQVNSYLKRLVDDDFILRNLSVKGELSNVKYHSSGHVYFSLKDEKGAIAAVMFRSDASRLQFRLQDGKQVIIRGSLGIYEVGGKYQIYAKSAEDAGKGDLALRFEELKKKLEEQGMFSAEYKKEIPAYSMKIGVVTAETGAVIRDIYNVATRRNPHCQILLYPSAVQGDGAAEQIARGIACLEQTDVDTIIIGRGGGSMEDLWAFNEEAVAQAIFRCSKPVISAVGHETDVTIADFVADLRAPTPSAAAELTVFDYAQFQKLLADYRYTLKLHLQYKLNQTVAAVKQYQLQLETLSPKHQLQQKKQMLLDLEHTAETLLQSKIEGAKEKVLLLTERLEGVSPLKRLMAGYSFAETAAGKPLKSMAQVHKDDVLTLYVTDGKIFTKVTDTQENQYE